MIMGDDKLLDVTSLSKAQIHSIPGKNHRGRNLWYAREQILVQEWGVGKLFSFTLAEFKTYQS